MPLLDQVLHDGDRARGGQLPVRAGTAASRSGACRCGRRPAAPMGCRAGSASRARRGAPASLSSSAIASGFRIAWPRSKNTSDWNTKRSPTMRMSGRLPRICAQAAEEVGAVAGELLHPLRQRDVEPAAEVGDRAWLSLSRDFRGVERLLQRGELAAQRRDLLVQKLDLRQRPRRRLLLALELAERRAAPPAGRRRSRIRACRCRRPRSASLALSVVCSPVTVVLDGCAGSSARAPGDRSAR